MADVELSIPESTAAPAGARAQTTADLLGVASEAWALGDVATPATVIDMGGTYNLNLRLQSDRGDVVLRVYRPWVSPERLAAVQALRLALWQEGIPTIVPLARSDGTTSISHHGRLMEVEPWVSSESGADSWERYLAAGTALGELHAALRRVRLPVPFIPAPISNVLSPAIFADWIAQTRRAIARTPVRAGSLDAMAVCDEAERLRALATRVPRPEHVVQLTHGDFAHENIRFFGAAPVAILDFDFVDHRDRITDIAYTTYWMFEHLQWDVPPAERDWWQAGELIRRYSEAAGLSLSPAELAYLPLAMATIPTTWVAESWLMGDAVHAIGLVARQMETVAWLIAHRGDLARMWGSCA